MNLEEIKQGIADWEIDNLEELLFHIDAMMEAQTEEAEKQK